MIVTSASVSPYYVLPKQSGRHLKRHGLSIATVVAGHFLVLAMLVGWSQKDEIVATISTINVRVLEMERHTPRQAAKTSPSPFPGPKRKNVAVSSPPAVLTAAGPSASASSFTVAPQAAAHAVPTTPAPIPSAARVTGARFDADYLQNPKPAYPNASKRLGEEGRVVLRVRVSTRGLPLSIEIKQSSGYARLDDAAHAAVEKWRFIPARQGSEAIDAWVLVPLTFKLDK